MVEITHFWDEIDPKSILKFIQQFFFQTHVQSHTHPGNFLEQTH